MGLLSGTGQLPADAIEFTLADAVAQSPCGLLIENRQRRMGKAITMGHLGQRARALAKRNQQHRATHRHQRQRGKHFQQRETALPLHGSALDCTLPVSQPISMRQRRVPLATNRLPPVELPSG